MRRRYPAGLRLEIGRFDDEDDGAGARFDGVGFVVGKYGAHAAGELNAGVEVGGDGDPAVDDQERGGVGDRGAGDAGALFQVQAADVSVAGAVGERVSAKR